VDPGTLTVGEISSPRVKRLAKEFLWVGAGQLAAVAGGLIGIRLLTQALSPVSYGELALALTVATLAQQVVLGPVAGAMLRFFAPAHEAKQLHSYLKGSRRLLADGTGVVLALAVLSGLALFLSGQTKWLSLLVGAFLYSLLSGYCAALDGIQNAARQRAVVAWHQGLGQWLRFSMALAIIAIWGARSSAAMLGYTIATSAVLASQIFLFRRKIVSMLSEQSASRDAVASCWTRPMRGYAWPFVIWGLFTWAQMASDRWALQLCGPPSAVGLYAAVYQLGYYPMILLSGFLSQLVLPILFGRAGDGTDKDRLAGSHRLNRLIFSSSMLLTLMGGLVAWTFHRQIFAMLVAPEYQQVSPWLPAMVLAGGLFAAAQVAGLTLLSEVDTKRLIAPKIVTALLGVGGNLVGAFWFGLPGVVCASVLFSMTYLTWVWLLTLGRPFRELNYAH